MAAVRYATGLRGLPPRVAWFHLRARRLAWRTGDRFSLTSATRPVDLAVLLRLARHRRRVVELGTGTAWTSLAFALADRGREVITYETVPLAERERYLDLVAPAVRSRIRFITAPGASGPQDDRPVDLLYVDSSHYRDETIEEFKAWQAALTPGALVVFDDYTHAEFPGVREAVRELRLSGVQQGTLFVHEIAPDQAQRGGRVPPSRGPGS